MPGGSAGPVHAAGENAKKQDAGPRSIARIRQALRGCQPEPREIRQSPSPLDVFRRAQPPTAYSHERIAVDFSLKRDI